MHINIFISLNTVCFKRFYFIYAPTKYTFTLQEVCKNSHLVTRVGPVIQPNNSAFKDKTAGTNARGTLKKTGT